jgi:hypothetical protein
MKNRLDQLLKKIEDKYQDFISENSRFYMEVEIGKEADEMGFHDIKARYQGVYALVLLKEAVRGMKVRIDGRTFVNYLQFESGIAVPGYIAKDSQRPHKRYVPRDSMICNFA